MVDILKKIKRTLFDKRTEVPEYPQSVLIEPTNACNLRCRMCSVWGEGVKRSREVGFIKRDIWMNALDEIGSWPANVNLDIHGAGEPLLHHELLDILSYAKSKGNITVGFLCNATLLDSRKAEAIIELGVDWVGFSVDGAQKEVFEHFRRGAVLSEVEDNIERLISLKRDGRPTIFLNMVGHDEADTGLFIDRWKGKVDSLSISIKKPLDRAENKQIIFKKPCPMLYQQLVMGWNGYSVLCCEDCWGEYIIGKFPEDSLYNIWQGRAINKARILHGKGMHDKISLCEHCDSCMFHEYKELNIENTYVKIELPSIKSEYGCIRS